MLPVLLLSLTGGAAAAVWPGCMPCQAVREPVNVNIKVGSKRAKEHLPNGLSPEAEPVEEDVIMMAGLLWHSHDCALDPVAIATSYQQFVHSVYLAQVHLARLGQAARSSIEIPSPDKVDPVFSSMAEC